ncbi:MAG: hypothetical protein II723_02995 [Oscillospiraceae bacterium]|nr:hypothetical protein [Oscillospiraceae bacterium]
MLLFAELPQFDSMYLIIGVIALILLIVLKTVKKAIRIILGIVAAAALLVWLSSKFGIELPFELPFL